jgi:CheY-like chemotaxis protein
MIESKKVVVVDDDAKVIMLVEKVLTQLGFRVFSASEGKKALELVLKEEPALLITDILQPGIDGIGLCQSIKEDPVVGNTKIILMSGVYKQASLKREIMDCTPDAFIEKPLEVQQLKDLVEKVLNS